MLWICDMIFFNYRLLTQKSEQSRGQSFFSVDSAQIEGANFVDADFALFFEFVSAFDAHPDGASGKVGRQGQKSDALECHFLDVSVGYVVLNDKSRPDFPEFGVVFFSEIDQVDLTPSNHDISSI